MMCQGSVQSVPLRPCRGLRSSPAAKYDIGETKLTYTPRVATLSVVGLAARPRRRRSARPDPRAAQLDLALPVKRGWGGKRPGSGRPRRAGGGAPHKARPALSARHPVHVVLRTAPAVHGLRRRACYHAIRWAVIRCARREDFRIVHLSIQQTHLHLLVEATDARALARGMQGFQISAAKLLNQGIRTGPANIPRRGAVFPDRYHATILRSPTQARHALAYVLNNWRKHWHQLPAAQRAQWIDPFSSSLAFPDWVEYGDAHFLWRGPPGYEPLLVFRPRTWLLRTGYLRGGPPISLAEVPSARA